MLVGAALALAAAGTAQAAATPAQVARAWSKALNANHNAAAAKLFAQNARVVQPGVDVRLSSRALAVAFNDALPCAGRIVAMHGERQSRDGNLRARPAAEAPLRRPGAKAAAVFTVRNGKIVRWQQVPVPASTGVTA